MGTAFHHRFANEMYRRIVESSKFASMVGPRPPPTRWQRIKWRLEDWRDRLRNAWRALRGEWPDYD